MPGVDLNIRLEGVFDVWAAQRVIELVGQVRPGSRVRIDSRGPVQFATTVSWSLLRL